jgi:hypothetical protein
VPVNKAEFLTLLESVAPGLAVRESVEQGSCFIFKGGKVITYNGEIACRKKCPPGIHIEGAVSAAPLLALLQKLAEEEIEISQKEGTLLIKGNGRRAEIRTDMNVVLPIEQVERPGEWHPLHEDFGPAIGVVSTCSAKDDANGFHITCVHIHPDFLEACDNYQLARYPIKTPISGGKMVKRENIKHVAELEMTEFSESATWIHFRNPGGLTLSCRHHADEFPNLDHVLDVADGAPATLPGGLAEAVDKAKIFSSENAQNDSVKVELRKEQLRLRGEGALGYYEERKKIKYDGPDLCFLIAPDLLVKLTKQHSECEVTKDRLKVNGGKFLYVTCLGTVDE